MWPPILQEVIPVSEQKVRSKPWTPSGPKQNKIKKLWAELNQEISASLIGLSDRYRDFIPHKQFFQFYFGFCFLPSFSFPTLSSSVLPAWTFSQFLMLCQLLQESFPMNIPTQGFSWAGMGWGQMMRTLGTKDVEIIHGFQISSEFPGACFSQMALFETIFKILWEIKGSKGPRSKLKAPACTHCI